MNPWFRFHTEALNDPKVQTLDGDTFKAWVNLLCIASNCGGKLPSIEDMAFALRCTVNAVETVLERLLNGGLIDKLNGGPNGYHYAPHGWTERQYKSDSSTGRVKRFRERSKTVTETAPDTDTDTDTETPIIPFAGNGKRYRFSGRVVRLTQADYDRFKTQFSGIPDFDAELTALDGWLSDQPEAKQKNWFGSTAPWLNKRHQEAMSSQKPKVKIGI